MLCSSLLGTFTLSHLPSLRLTVLRPCSYLGAAYIISTTVLFFSRNFTIGSCTSIVPLCVFPRSPLHKLTDRNLQRRILPRDGLHDVSTHFSVAYLGNLAEEQGADDFHAIAHPTLTSTIARTF